jgi:hypothetical protein
MTTATTPMTEQTAGVPPELLLGDHQSGVQLVRQHARGRWFKSLALLAGSGYGVAWVAGLVVWPSNLSIDASRRDIVSLYAAHTRQAAVQYLLVEGLAGVLLGIVLFYCVRRLSRCARTWTSQVALGGGVVVAISLLQCLVGQDLVFSASKGHLDQSGDIYQLINRLDGAKQLALSVCVVALGTRLRATASYPLWLSRITVILGPALATSGLAYLLLWGVLAGTTFVSLPLLVVWVAGSGIWLGTGSQSEQRGERGGEGRPDRLFAEPPLLVTSGASPDA